MNDKENATRPGCTPATDEEWARARAERRAARPLHDKMREAFQTIVDALTELPDSDSRSRVMLAAEIVLGVNAHVVGVQRG